MHRARSRSVLVAAGVVIALVAAGCTSDDEGGDPTDAPTGGQSTAPAGDPTSEPAGDPTAGGVTGPTVEFSFAQPNATVVFNVDAAAAGRNYTGDPYEFRASQTWSPNSVETVIAVGQFMQGFFSDRLVICIGADGDSPECVSSPPDALVTQAAIGAVPQFAPGAPLFDEYILTLDGWMALEGASDFVLEDAPASSSGLAPLLVCVEAPLDGQQIDRCDFDGGGTAHLDLDADGTREIELISYEDVTPADMEFPVDVVDNPARFLEIIQNEVPQLA